MEKMEQMKKDAWEFVRCQCKAQKMMYKRYESLSDNRIYRLNFPDAVHMTGLIKLCELIGIEYERSDWEGNAQCESNWDEVQFTYKGVKFFDLVDKEDDENEGE